MPIIVAGARTGNLKQTVSASSKVTVLSDIAQRESLPAALSQLPVREVIGVPERWAEVLEAPAGSDAFAWFSNECISQANEASAREVLLREHAITFTPIHLPVSAELCLDLIALQPRVATGRRSKVFFTQDLRFYSVRPASSQFHVSLRKSNSWWARHSMALYEEQVRPGSGLKALQRMWQKEEMTPLQKCLVLRNLAVCLMRNREYEKADSLLVPGAEAFPDYGDFRYLAALSLVLQGRASKAVSLLEQACKMSPSQWPGSGGENWYRPRWLLGKICADLGRDELAMQNLLPSLLARPAFGPGVDTLFRMQLPPDQVERIFCPLQQLRIREPEYSVRVDEFLRRHGIAAEAEAKPKPLTVEEAAGSIVIEGPILDSCSLARVNRELGQTLMHAGISSVQFKQTSFATAKAESFPGGLELQQRLNHPPHQPHVVIRQSWPPDIRKAPGGRLINFLHWEYSAVPLKWVDACNSNADEVWVPSRFTHRAFIRAGVLPEKIKLMPLGFQPDIFSPHGTRWHPEQCREFSFLFVGGAIKRKGIDLLLDAYREAFRAVDDVTLIIKVSGADSFYRHNSLLTQARKNSRESGAPQIMVLTDDLSDSKMAMLYRGANVLVHPYRAEGFGLPLLEAMACGTPVITTDAGPAPEFCPRESSLFLPACQVEVTDDPPPLGRLSGSFTWFEPDLLRLVQQMRWAYEHQDELYDMGMQSAEHVLRQSSWDQLSSLFISRVQEHLRSSTAGATSPQLVGA